MTGRPLALALALPTALALAAALTGCAAAIDPLERADPVGNIDPVDDADRTDNADRADVRVTWLSVTNWLLEVGATRILLDGYLTRIDRRLLDADGSSGGTAVTDTAELRRLLEPALPDLRVDWILVGHGHWDHAFDVPALARLTGARIAGARTVCHQALALGLAADLCTAVEGGEVLDVADDVRVRVVRWHHSGDPATDAGRRLAAPLELRAPPAVDPATGGLRPGFLEDYPNGGGSRAYLITVGDGPESRTLFWSNTGNPDVWDVAQSADTAALRDAGVDLTNLVAAPGLPTRDALAAALEAEGVAGVDVWLGFAGEEHVRQVVATLRPRALVPHHWDDLWTPIGDGPGRSFSDVAIRPFLDSAGIRLVVPEYYRRLRLDELAGPAAGDGVGNGSPP